MVIQCYAEDKEDGTTYVAHVAGWQAVKMKEWEDTNIPYPPRYPLHDVAILVMKNMAEGEMTPPTWLRGKVNLLRLVAPGDEINHNMESFPRPMMKAVSITVTNFPKYNCLGFSTELDPYLVPISINTTAIGITTVTICIFQPRSGIMPMATTTLITTTAKGNNTPRTWRKQAYKKARITSRPNGANRLMSPRMSALTRSPTQETK